MSCAVPPEWLTIRILPSAPTGTTARFGSVCPARKLTLDVDADGAPFAYAVSQPASSGVVTVRFTTTADTPWLGTPPTPVTCTATDADGPTRARGAPVPLRVSSTRNGATLWNSPPADFRWPHGLLAAP